MEIIPHKEKNRIEWLDSLRGLAILFVLFYHYTTRYFELFDSSWTEIFQFTIGEYGVHLFFCISGYVIFMTVSKKKKAKDFVISRFTRLYPVYWASVLLTFLVVHLASLEGRTTSAAEMLFNLTMFQEFLKTKHVDGVYWTLTVELLFYYSIVLMLQTNMLKHINKILVCWLVISIISLYTGNIGMIAKIAIFPWIGFFATGISFFNIHKNIKDIRMPSIIILMSLISSYFWHGIEVLLVHFTIILIFLVARYINLLSSKLILFFGSISYPLYLIHQNIGYVILRWFDTNGLPYILALIVTTSAVILIATILSIYIEKPALKKLRGMMIKKVVAK